MTREETSNARCNALSRGTKIDFNGAVSWIWSKFLCESILILQCTFSFSILDANEPENVCLMYRASQGVSSFDESRYVHAYGSLHTRLQSCKNHSEIKKSFLCFKYRSSRVTINKPGESWMNHNKAAVLYESWFPFRGDLKSDAGCEKTKKTNFASLSERFFAYCKLRNFTGEVKKKFQHFSRWLSELPVTRRQAKTRSRGDFLEANKMCIASSTADCRYETFNPKAAAFV